MLKLKIRLKQAKPKESASTLRKMFLRLVHPPPVEINYSMQLLALLFKVQRKKNGQTVPGTVGRFAGRIPNDSRFKIQDSPTFKILKSEDIGY